MAGEGNILLNTSEKERHMKLVSRKPGLSVMQHLRLSRGQRHWVEFTLHERDELAFLGLEQEHLVGDESRVRESLTCSAWSPVTSYTVLLHPAANLESKHLEQPSRYLVCRSLIFGGGMGAGQCYKAPFLHLQCN